MASRQPSSTESAPWELRLGAALRLPPWAAGTLTAAALALASVAYYRLLGLPLRDPASGAPFALSGSAHASLGNCLLLGYALGAALHMAEWMPRALDRAAPIAAGGPKAVRASSLRAGRLAGGAAVALVATVLSFAILQRGHVEAPTGHLPDALWPLALTLLTAWAVGRAAWFTLRGAGRSAGAVAAGVDLLDLPRLDVFGRIGLHMALVWVIGISLGLLVAIFDPSVSDTRTALPFLILTGVVATLALVLPVREVRRRIQETKRAELDLLDTELRRLHRAERSGTPPPPGRLADLLARRAFVLNLREWPFDTPTLLRFAIYLLIPLGSWLGGALMERALARVLG